MALWHSKARETTNQTLFVRLVAKDCLIICQPLFMLTKQKAMAVVPCRADGGMSPNVRADFVPFMKLSKS